MNKIFLTLVFQLFVVCFAFAQGGIGGNSDWKVPVPLISPQNDPPITYNQIIVPNMLLIPASAFSSANPLLVPQFPPMPTVPREPHEGIEPAELQNNLKRKTTSEMMLPPIPLIPSSPSVKMPVN